MVNIRIFFIILSLSVSFTDLNNDLLLISQLFSISSGLIQWIIEVAFILIIIVIISSHIRKHEWLSCTTSICWGAPYTLVKHSLVLSWVVTSTSHCHTSISCKHLVVLRLHVLLFLLVNSVLSDHAFILIRQNGLFLFMLLLLFVILFIVTHFTS